MRRILRTGFALGLVGMIAALASPALAAGKSAAPRSIRAKFSVELDDPKGDVGPIQVGPTDKMVEKPGFDMVHLSIRSDGKQLVVAATLSEPPGNNVGSAVDVYLDTDNNAKSGAELPVERVAGFEYHVTLDACANYDDHLGPTCGVTRSAKATSNWGAVRVDRYKSAKEYERDAVIEDGDFAMHKAAIKSPVAGAVVRGVVDYADLQLKSGQTIRILAREWTKRAPGSRNDPVFCPEIVLTLR